VTLATSLLVVLFASLRQICTQVLLWCVHACKQQDSGKLNCLVLIDRKQVTRGLTYNPKKNRNNATLLQVIYDQRAIYSRSISGRTSGHHPIAPHSIVVMFQRSFWRYGPSTLRSEAESRQHQLIRFQVFSRSQFHASIDERWFRYTF
jgi:hypothetical protein